MPETSNAPKYHQMLKHKPEAIRAVRNAIKGGLFKAATRPELKEELLRTMGKEIMTAYGIAQPFTLAIDQRVGDAMGAYIREAGAIVLNKPSLVTFLHELAHHLQFHRDGSTTENYARAFSLGLFWKATPNLFAAAVAAGKVAFMESSALDQASA